MRLRLLLGVLVVLFPCCIRAAERDLPSGMFMFSYTLNTKDRSVDEANICTWETRHNVGFLCSKRDDYFQLLSLRSCCSPNPLLGSFVFVFFF